MSVSVVIPQVFESQLRQRMSVPHRLIPFSKETDSEMRDILRDSDVIVSGAYKAEWKLDRTTRPLLVHSPGAGVDGIVFDSLPAAATVCNVYGHERGVAEQVGMVMLALQRQLFRLDHELRRGNWCPDTPYLPELRNRRLLVLGSGHIGRELVRWGKFLEMNVVVLTRNPTPERAASLGVGNCGSLQDLAKHLPDADFVVIAIPAAPGTIDLIGRKELGLMKRTAFLINVGRAPVVNEEALYTALRERTIAGAGLDVWYRYPTPGQNAIPSTQPFHELSNVIMTPHKPTIETMEYRWREIADNIARHVAGEPLKNVVWRKN
jgi:phosphoglycerate dehydrogenase-like enzyme